MPADRIIKDNAIVLRTVRFSQTSQVVTWLTRNHGRIATTIKGAKRPKSAFLGQYDLFYTCELLYYARERGGAHIAKECSPAKPRQGLRASWKSVLCASYTCDLAARLCPHGEPAPDMFDFLDLALDFLARETPRKGVIPWMELKAAGHAGFAPSLDGCVLCGGNGPGPEAGKTAGFAPAHGGTVCAGCAKERRVTLLPAGADTLATMRSWQVLDDPARANDSGISGRQMDELCAATGAFLEYHLHPLPTGRKVALVLM